MPAIGVHVVLTILENSPDGKIGLGRRVSAFSILPQWRFFAPNPGIDNSHLFARIRPSEDAIWADWIELRIENPLRPYSALWNPGGRAPKALFDSIQQMKILEGFGGSYDWAVRSIAYQVIRLYTKEHLKRAASAQGTFMVENGEFQFMLLTSRPGETESIEPVLVSEICKFEQDYSLTPDGIPL
jgi:hypothetical protein